MIDIEAEYSEASSDEILNILMANYATDLKRIAFLYVNEMSECEDIIQEVFISCYQKLPSFRHECSYKTWLIRITINKCKDYKKRWSIKNLIYKPIISTVITAPSAEEQEIEDNKHIKASLDNVVNGKVNKSNQKFFSSEVTNNLQLAIIKDPEKYKLKKASFNYWSKEITLALSFQSQKNSYFTQIFKGEIDLEDNHEVVEKVGNWSLIPDSNLSNMEEHKYIIAVSEIMTNHEKYTIIVQTYDLHDDIDAAPYSKTDILNFTESLKPELAVKNLLEIIPKD